MCGGDISECPSREILVMMTILIQAPTTRWLAAKLHLLDESKP
jgi:hypothetical protein